MCQVCIFVANKLEPCIIGMKSVCIGPRIYKNFGSSVKRGRHCKLKVLCKLHNPLSLLLVRIAVRMWAFMRIGKVPVQVHTVCVIACGTVHVVVPTVIGAIRVHVGAYIEVYVLQHVGTLRQSGIFQYIIYQAEHKHPSCSFIAVHGRYVKESGLAIT